METQSKTAILLVDDKPGNLTVLQAVLDDPTYELVLAHSGKEAVKMANEREFAAILLDVQMPQMDGIATAKEIHRSGLSRKTPILFITALYQDDAYINLGYEAGAVDYIFKPFNPHILRSKVSVFVDLFLNSKKLLIQSELLRLAEGDRRARELAEVRIRALQREHELNRRYVDLVNSIENCIIWSADPSSLLFSFVSQKSEALTGYSVSAGSDGVDYWRIHAPPEDRRIVDSMIKKARQGIDTSADHRFICRSGKVLWLRTTITSRSQSQGLGNDLRGLTVNVTQTKEAELKLKASEETQRFLAEAGTQLAASLDYSLTLERIARLAVPRFGTWCAVHMLENRTHIKIVAAAHQDQSKTDLIYALDQAKLFNFGSERGVPAVIASGMPELMAEAINEFSVETEAGAGAESSAELVGKLGIRSYVCVPMLSREQVLGTITFVSSERPYQSEDLLLFEELARRAAIAIDNALLYREAEDAIHMKDEFLSIASHEMRTPLTPLKLQLQNVSKLVRDGQFALITPELLTRALTKSDRQIDRLNGLIENLLNVSKINLDRLKLERSPSDLRRIILDVADQLKEQLAHAGCTLLLELDDEITGDWDAFKLEQCIINLLTNAIKYGAGKPITIHASNDGPLARVCVQDRGIGIDVRDHKRIFGLFERAAPTQNYGGLGLGLYIVHNIIRQHGGNITIESAPGNGAKFLFEIPKRAMVSLTQTQSRRLPGQEEQQLRFNDRDQTFWLRSPRPVKTVQDLRDG